MTIGHSAESHKVTRKGQKENLPNYHHPDEKMNQLSKFTEYMKGKKILEVFGGRGNLTKFYSQYGEAPGERRDP